MRVLLIANSLYPETTGGMQMHLRLLLRMLRADHEVSVLTRDSDSTRPEYSVRAWEHDGVVAHSINNTFAEATALDSLYDLPGVNAAAENVLREVRPDVVHVHHLTCLSMGILQVCRDRRIPVVMTLHDQWMMCPRGQRVDPDGNYCAEIDRARCRPCMRRTWPQFFREGDAAADLADDLASIERVDRNVARLLGVVDRFIAPSRHILEEFAAYGLERSRVIPHAVDPQLFAGAPSNDSDGGVFRLGFVGAVIPSKGLHDLFAAVGDLGERVRVDVHGEVVSYHGEDGYLDQLEAARPDGVAIRFHGAFVPEDVGTVLGSLDALVVPSICAETFSLVVREAFLAGTPVIGARRGALIDALAAARGLLFEPGDHGDLRDQIVRLMEDADTRRLVRGRPEWVATPAEMVEATLAVYRDAIQSSVARTRHDHLYLSPHLDDAALSCGGMICRSVREGEGVLVATIFSAAAPPDAELSPLAATMHRHWGDPVDCARVREREERASMTALGAARIHLGYLDCIYRRGSGAAPWSYPEPGDLVGAVHPADDALVDRIAADVSRLLAASPGALIHAPLAVGGHVDHRIAHRVGLTLAARGQRVVFYEDYPYSDPAYPLVPTGHDHTALDVRLEALTEAGQLYPRVERFALQDLERKVASIDEFQSQIPTLFATSERAAQVVREQAFRLGGAEPAERVWELRPAESDQARLA